MPTAIGAAAVAAYRGTGAAAAPGGAEFGATLRRAVEGAVDAARGADAASTRSLVDGTGVTDAVLAISRAETALQTAVAVRDRVVSAYQDIMRMPI
ncbi:flagellar hook-basal body complex protein FliE [Roseomonas sp. CCTCC AB2023176]|uniref:flagellar hook-basal body complex protein FliE n=1 Tax=Roseomonas sp. CCTCC AB2023176 TaxID=3342640 RepID=UPI0035D8B013